MKALVKDDQWFVDNGYLTENYDKSASYVYRILSPTEKLKAVWETHVRLNGITAILTPEILAGIIETGAERERQVTYVKLSREEKDKRTAERHKVKENANRKS